MKILMLPWYRNICTGLVPTCRQRNEGKVPGSTSKKYDKEQAEGVLSVCLFMTLFSSKPFGYFRVYILNKILLQAPYYKTTP
jgi:hypothetical protein